MSADLSFEEIEYFLSEIQESFLFKVQDVIIKINDICKKIYLTFFKKYSFIEYLEFKNFEEKREKK